MEGALRNVYLIKVLNKANDQEFRRIWTVKRFCVASSFERRGII